MNKLGGGGGDLYQELALLANEYTKLSKETTNSACTWTIKPTLKGLSAISISTNWEHITTKML